MPRNQIDPNKAKKTAALVVLANAVLFPLYFLDSKLGLAASISGTALLLHNLNEIGKERRPGANLINRANNFFGPYTGDPNTDAQNALRNIVNGGEAVFDQMNAPGAGGAK